MSYLVRDSEGDYVGIFELDTLLDKVLKMSADQWEKSYSGSGDINGFWIETARREPRTMSNRKLCERWDLTTYSIRQRFRDRYKGE